MNYRGSYKKLLGNAKSAMMAAIEIYNKPVFQYRDECMVILLFNAWELVLKALLSKHKQSIYYPKKRKQPYRTLSWQDALLKAQRYFPKTIPHLPVRKNLELLRTYRDNAVHFYNARDFSVVLYALSQTAIMNFRDLLEGAFDVSLENELNWQLLPLGIRPPVDVVSYISGESTPKMSSPVRQFVTELAKATEDLKREGADTGRLMTVFNVKLESVKKIGDADVTVGIGKNDTDAGPLAFVRTQDPNQSHPLRQMDVLKKIGRELTGKQFTSYTFQAISWKHDLKNKSQYCWRAKEGVLTKYSNDVVSFLKNLTQADIEAALRDYKQHQQKKQRAKKAKNK